MEKVTSISELNSLILPYFKRGVITNNFLMINDYNLYLKEQSLFYEKTENNLFLIRCVEDISYVYFYINKFEDIKLPNNSVIEIVEPNNEIIEYFCKLGFVEVNKREEMQLINQTSDDDEFDFCKTEELEKVRRIIKDNFDRFYGNIPSLDELKLENVLVSRDNEDNITGLLHFKTIKSISSILHIAVIDKNRGNGIGSKILSGYINHEKDKCREFRLWVNSDNKKAIDFYKKNGYDFSNRKSVVLVKKGAMWYG